MTCAPGDLSCRLREIADALNGWSWPAFTSTLIATLVGAAVALLGSWLLARRDRAERYATRLDEALAQVLILLAVYTAAMEGRQLRARMFAIPPVQDPPPTTELEAALDVVRLLARGHRDENIAGWLHTAFTNATAVFPDKELPLVKAIAPAIRRWRHGDREQDVVREIMHLNGAR